MPKIFTYYLNDPLKDEEVGYGGLNGPRVKKPIQFNSLTRDVEPL